jgi:hypothetical protein
MIEVLSPYTDHDDTAFAPSPYVSQNTSLPLYVSSRYISWMAPKGVEDGLRMPRHRRWLWKNRPSAPYVRRPRPLIEIGERIRYVGSRRRGTPRA